MQNRWFFFSNHVAMVLTATVVLVCCSLAPSLVAAQPEEPNPNEVIKPELLSGLEYRMVGPHRGGRATTATGVPGQPHLFYFGGTGSGVWKTDDAGESWKNITDGQFEVGSVGAIAVAESDPNVIHVGTGSACIRGNVSPGIGMYDAIVNKLTGVENELVQTKSRGFEDPLNYPGKLYAQLANVHSVTNGAFVPVDAPPTDGAHEFLTELKSQASEIYGRLQSVLDTDVARFNELVGGLNLPSVIIKKPES